MKKNIVSFIKLALSLGLGVGLVYWFMGQLSDNDKLNIVADAKRANYLWVVVPPLIGFISNYFRTERWRLLLRSLGYNPGFLNTFLSVMIMYFLNLFVPRLGEVSRCGILARYENIPVDRAIGTMVLERLMDVVVIALVALGLVLLEHDKFMQLYDMMISNSKATFGDIISKYQVQPAVKYAVFGTLFLGIILFLAYQVRKQGWENIVAGFKGRFIGLIKGIISIKDVDSPGLFLFHTVGIWVCYFLMAYTGFFMFPETSHLTLLTGGVCLFFSGVAASLTPGGLGLFPIFYKLILGLYGVTGSAANSLGLVTWGVQTVAVLAMGVISLILLAILNREPSLSDVTPDTNEVTLKS
ncbi:MAG: hypothetical protein JWO06_2642 [Bacteroidota bacterium]|nr:hypothetical protein [Bacteroidota bacterium]